MIDIVAAMQQQLGPSDALRHKVLDSVCVFAYFPAK